MFKIKPYDIFFETIMTTCMQNGKNGHLRKPRKPWPDLSPSSLEGADLTASAISLIHWTDSFHFCLFLTIPYRFSLVLNWMSALNVSSWSFCNVTGSVACGLLQNLSSLRGVDKKVLVWFASSSWFLQSIYIAKKIPSDL